MRRDIRQHYLGWTILERSCELKGMAQELEDRKLVTLLDEVASLAGEHVDAPAAVVAKICREHAKLARLSAPSRRTPPKGKSSAP